ncbi:MAG: monothiol bacilliredoxin BrxC family protein [Candidatus Eisenbacteria bacterium]
MHETMMLPVDPADAVRALRERSATAAVLLFKKSPYCGTSAYAEGELLWWLDDRKSEKALVVAEVDVVNERSLARGITAELGIEHQSPQVLLFVNGEVKWHGSHGELTGEKFGELVDGEA